MRTARTLAWVALLLAAAGAAQAAAPPLTASMRMAAARARTGAPMWVDVDVANHTPSLIEGRLQLVFSDGMEEVGRYTGWDMALANGTQAFRLMLPQFAARGRSQMLTAQVSFVTDRGAYELGQQWLPVAAPIERACVLAVGTPGLASAGPAALVRSLQLEHYAPQADTNRVRQLGTFSAAVPPEEFPETPLGYCPYDIVVLPADAFALVRQRQLDALGAWVRAGGSVCVLPGPGPLKPYQEEFLKALSGGAPRGAGAGMYRCGLGRAVVAAQPDSFDTPDWRRAAGFLWKVRDDGLDALARGGTWPAAAEAPQEAAEGVFAPPGMVGSGRPMLNIMGLQPLPTAVNFYQPLMPASLHLVPLSWIAVLLLLLVVAIGPADYVLLGLIRRRKLTWVLFPALCVGFSLCMMAMARHCLGSNEQRGAYVFVDLGQGGRVLRTSRYELVYAAGESTVDTRYRDAVACPLDPSMFARWQFYNNYGPYLPADPDGRVEAARLRRPPARLLRAAPAPAAVGAPAHAHADHRRRGAGPGPALGRRDAGRPALGRPRPHPGQADGRRRLRRGRLRAARPHAVGRDARQFRPPALDAEPL